MCLTSGVDRIVSRDNVSEQFIEYTRALNEQRFRYKLFTGYNSHHDYAERFGQGMETVQYEDVESPLVAIRWRTIAAYYNAIPMRRYGAWTRMNRNRLSYIESLPEGKCEELVRVGSANSWELVRHDGIGYCIYQTFNPEDTIIEVINRNYEFTQVIGKLSRIHAHA